MTCVLPDNASAVASEVVPREFARLLGYPAGRGPEGRAAELAAGARAWYARHGRPWTRARLMAIAALDGDTVRLEGGVALTGPALAERLRKAEAHAVFVVAVSAGPEADAEATLLWRGEKPDEAFMLDMFAAAVVERLVTTAGATLCDWADPQGMAVLPHYSPGYRGWDLRDQATLFRLAAEEPGRPLPGPLSILESGMLVPPHSLLGVFGVTRRTDLVSGLAELSPCSGCSFAPCAYRRAPYRPATEQEPVRVARPRPPAATSTAPAPVYAFPERALRRWTKDHLSLVTDPHGAVVARFRFLGSTCSNGGIPLEFLFEVRLGPLWDAHRIRYAVCRPASGDDGHQAMCAYRADPDGFLGRIQRFEALDGKPLDDVLAWSPEINPAACLCTHGNRNHKWRMVLQTIHFALTAQDK